jgi:hypothetical protein
MLPVYLGRLLSVLQISDLPEKRASENTLAHFVSVSVTKKKVLQHRHQVQILKTFSICNLR